MPGRLPVIFAVICISLWGQSLFAEEKSAKEPFRAEVCMGCHQSQYDTIKSSRHWVTGDQRTAVNLQKCSTCHGDAEAHVMSGGQARAEGLQGFHPKSTDMTPHEQNAVCTSCHQGASFIHWETGAHAAEDVGCVGCHRLHEEDKVTEKQSQAEVCYSCHADMRSLEHRPYGHPMREGKMICSDCHGVHGGPGDAGLKTFSVNDTCYTCHAEKRGPFLWEHPPVSENCVLCHSAHGSVNQGMLTRRQPHLCQSCHEATGMANKSTGPHVRHSRLALSYRAPGEPDVGPDGIGNRGISRLVMGEGCMNCHSQVHGTNHPSGANLMR
jgi:DmsE family decaheme c-type cytochrome